MSQTEKLCDILLNQNLAVCNSIANGEFDQKKLFKYFKESAHEIRKLKMSHGNNNNTFIHLVLNYIHEREQYIYIYIYT